MRTSIIALGVAAGLATAIAGHTLAGPDRVALPEDYAERFVLYNQIDRPDRGRVRFMYVSPDTHAEASAGQPIPNGTVLIMEDHQAELDASEEPVLGPDGRMIPTDEVTAIFVMEKQEGWGQDYPPEMRNGDWDYAWYQPDGSPRPDANFDGCFACHLNRAQGDFTFTYTPYLRDRQGM